MLVSRRCRSVGLSVKYFLSTSCFFESHVGKMSFSELSCYHCRQSSVGKYDFV